MATTSHSKRRAPLKYSGSLDIYKSSDLTPIIGREFPELQLSTLISDDTKLRDLAILGMFFLGNDLEQPMLIEYSFAAGCDSFSQSRLTD